MNGSGIPVWRHITSPFFMYSGTSGRWLVGGELEEAKGFISETGAIASRRPHKGVWPHDLAGEGQYWSEVGLSWQDFRHGR